MARRRRNPIVNEFNWTPIVIIGGLGLAAWLMYQNAVKKGSYKPPSGGGTPAGNFLCWISGGVIAGAANEYVNLTSCPPDQATGTVTLPNGQTVNASCGHAYSCGGQSKFSYGCTCYNLSESGFDGGCITRNLIA